MRMYSHFLIFILQGLLWGIESSVCEVEVGHHLHHRAGRWLAHGSSGYFITLFSWHFWAISFIIRPLCIMYLSLRDTVETNIYIHVKNSVRPLRRPASAKQISVCVPSFSVRLMLYTISEHVMSFVWVKISAPHCFPLAVCVSFKRLLRGWCTIIWPQFSSLVIMITSQ